MASLRIAPVLRSTRPSSSRLSLTSIRCAHDLTIQHRPGSSSNPQAVIKKGPPTGGRSAASGHTVTVFGCTGFLGRYLVSKLGAAGVQVVIPYRDEDDKRHLRVQGDLGQIVPLEWDARNADQIYECLKHSDTVYNLTGKDWETRNFKYHDVNVKAAGLIAKVAADAGVSRLIHVSHLNASPDSPSELYRTKYEGEQAVREAYPEATIVRPGLMFGYEDWLLNDMAKYPIKYKLNHGRTRIMPVHVLDVAEALNVMLSAPVTSTASTFALPGPEVYTYNELLNIVQFFTMNIIPEYPTIPKPLAKFAAGILNRAIWWPTMSPDEVERKFIDDIGVEACIAKAASERPSGWDVPVDTRQVGVNGEPVKGFKELDIIPDLIEERALPYLRDYRSATNWDRPVELGHYKASKRYHVVP